MRFIFWLYLLPIAAAVLLCWQTAVHEGFGFWAIMGGLFTMTFIATLVLPFVIDRIL